MRTGNGQNFDFDPVFDRGSLNFEKFEIKVEN
jgi:hypothetical protein